MKRCAVITRTDITLRKTAEADATAQRQQLQHMGRAAVLGELSGAIAHELNQPLTSILANAEAGIRMMDMAPIDVAEVRDILRDIVKADLRAASVIQRLRALLMRGEKQRQPVDLAYTVGEVLELTHSDLVTRHISAEIEADPRAPTVLVDRVQIQQLVLNLVMNACEAMNALPANARRLKISTRWRHADAVVEVAVSDSGVGLTDTAIGQIFEPFFTTKPQGLGLGLSICRTIVEAHGGRLWAENAEPTGATFRFTIPTS